MKTPRKVYIIQDRNTWFVRYVERAKGQRHGAAQFDARDHTHEDVVKWVEGKPELELVWINLL